jgi:hypothetical protein
MFHLLQRLVQDEAGFVVSSELVLVSTLGVFGMVVGMTSVRDQMVQELGDVSAALSDVNQSYYWGPVWGHHSWTAGSAFRDHLDDCDGVGDPPMSEPAGIWLDHDHLPSHSVWWEYPDA